MSLMTIVMVALVSVSLTACGDEDDEDNGGNGGGSAPSELIGTWYKESGATKYSMSFTFNEGGSGTGRVSHNNIFSVSAFAFQYSYKNGIVTCKGKRAMADEDGEQTIDTTLKFRLSSGKLTFTDAPNTAWIGAVLSKD